MITLTTVEKPQIILRLFYNFAFTASFVILSGKHTKFSLNMFLI